MKKTFYKTPEIEIISFDIQRDIMGSLDEEATDKVQLSDPDDIPTSGLFPND